MYNIKTNMSLMRLIESWAIIENPFNSTEDILCWIEEKNTSTSVKIEKHSYDYSGDNWHYDAEYGDIRNKDATFFQIAGLQKIQDGGGIAGAANYNSE